jgi:cbb3-type cytochrome oxidase maturation protein
MSIIYVMIPLALILVGVAVWALVWAIRSGQFDELESHGWTPVLDDDRRPPPIAEGEGGQAEGQDDASGEGRQTDGAPSRRETPRSPD